jgi:hypothetical protein
MTATYQELLKKAYIQRLRNQKDGNSILACLDSIFEDYLEEVNAEALAKELANTPEPVA